MLLPKDIREVFNKSSLVYSKEEIEIALDKIAVQLTARFAESSPLFLCVVVGGIVPLGNLLLRIQFPLEVDYIHVTRYGKAIVGGEISWRAVPTADLKDRTVIIVDDILDGGLTMQAIIDYCNEHGAKEVCTAVMLDKKKPREPGGLDHADFVGLEVDDRFVFGYGLDYKEYLRNAPGIYAVD